MSIHTMKPMSAFPGFLFGCDPELFVFGPDNQPVCADGLIPGTKHEPFKVEYGAVQVDGMAAEFNIDPVDNYKDWARNIDAVVQQLTEMLPAGHTLRALPSVIFSEEVFKKAPAHAKELGCSPDFNAWTEAKNKPPASAFRKGVDRKMRTAAGHIHIGWQSPDSALDADHIMNCNDLVRQLDWYLGAWSVSIDKDKSRRSLYGKAGACRYKPYGVEYRVLSNFWVLNDDIRQQVWNRLQTALFDMQDHHIPTKVPHGWDSILQKCVNASDTESMYPTSTFAYPLSSLDKSKSIYA